MRAAVYARLSFDRDGTSTATERQEADARKLCDDRGWEVVEVLVDNDVSAFDRKVKRPAFEQLLGTLTTGTIDTVVVWKTDRLARRGRDLQRFLDACEKHTVTLTSCTEPEFTGSTGLLMLRILSGFAEHESSVKSERVTRASKEHAESGAYRVGGRRVFGYTTHGELEPGEAALYREAVERLLAGERTPAVCADWRQRRIKTVTGSEWTTSNFTRMMRAPRHAGINMYHGVEIGDGSWEALVERERWDLLQAVLDGRAANYIDRQPRVTRHLLSGLAHCQCGAGMYGTKRKTWIEYRCSADRGGCGKVTIRASRLEEAVLERFMHVVSTPGWAQMLAQATDDSNETAAAVAQLRELETSLEQLTKDHYVEQVIARPAFMAAQEALSVRIGTLRSQVARQATPLASVPTDGDRLRAEWGERGPAWQRSVLEHAIEAVVVKAGYRYDDRVTVKWRA